MRKATMMIVCMVLYTVSMQAQVDYPTFKNTIEINPADSQKLSLSVDNVNYLYNTEYFTDIPLSGTLFGYQLVPELRFQPNKRLVLKGGIYLQKEFGRQGYTTNEPTFSIKYLAKHCSLLLGTLEGNLNHGYIEPIYDYQTFINHRNENGLQFKVFTKPYLQDLFINWTKAIHPGDTFKEEFDIGLTSRLNIYNSKKVEFGVPIQLLYSHKGGQFDTSGAPLQSLFNFALGGSVTFKFEHQFLQKIVADNYWVYYKDISFTKLQKFDSGNAYFSHLLFNFKWFDVDFRYWRGNGYIGPRGGGLFSSISQTQPNHSEKIRKLLLMSLIYDREILKNVHFDIRFSPYNDFVNKMLEYSYEVYLRYRINIFLRKIKT